LGFRLISEYQQRKLSLPGDIVIEEYELVIMSSLQPGMHMLSVAGCDFGAMGSRMREQADLPRLKSSPSHHRLPPNH
jgi:hypothetical protein